MDKIMAHGLRFKGCHGVLDYEKKQAQEFIIDLDLYLGLKKAGITDDINNTVDYAQVFRRVQKIVQEGSYNLIESLAEKIADILLQEFPLEAVEITVYKPQAPVEGEFDYFAVKVERESQI